MAHAVKAKVPVIDTSRQMQSWSSTFDPPPPEGAVGGSGAAPGNHWMIQPPNSIPKY